MNINRSYLRGAIIAIVVMVGTISAAYAAEPTTPFEISGNIFYGNGSECNNATVNIANLNASGTWVAETNESSNYYQMMLDSDNVSANDTLQFSVTSPDGSQSSVTEHVVTQGELNNGGFVYNIDLAEPADTTPPEITSVALDSAEFAPNESITVTVTATDNVGIAGVTANGIALAFVVNDTYEGTISAADAPGTYNVIVVATDAAGNAATNNSTTYTIPEPAPAIIAIEDVVVRRGERETVPIIVSDVVNMSGCEVNFIYDPAVVHVTDVARGDMNFSFEYNINNGSGWMRANALDAEGRSGNVTFAYLTLNAVGNKGAASGMVFENSRLADEFFTDITHNRRNGTFSILPNVLPVVMDVSATPDTMLYDNGRPRTPNTNISLLSVVHVDDTDGNVTNVTINLSSIGRSPVQPMEHLTRGTWAMITTATEVDINAPDFTHQLTITATDDDGGINNSVSIELTVLKRGDVNGDGLVDKMDADYISRCLAGLEPEASNPPGVLVGDVVGEAGDPVGNGVVDLMDALYIAKYTEGMVGEP